MPLLGALVLAIQFCFAFHALRTGRPYWWLFVIMSFPVMGCVIYYFVEIFPNSREHRQAHRTARNLVKVLRPDADLKRRAEELEICGSVDNKLAMAEECANHQMFGEAIALYESCLHGAFAADANILFSLAQTAVEAGLWEKSEKALAAIRLDEMPVARRDQIQLLQARLLEGRGQTDAALAAYRALIPVFVGLEARYRYGALLLRLGQNEAASAMFDEVLKHAKRFASSLDDERRWVSAARQALSGRAG